MYIDIVFTIDDKYVKQCATVIVSIIKNTNTSKKIRFHILSDFISENNKNALLKLKHIKDFEILFYKINMEKVDKFPLNRHWISIATYYRLLISEVLPKEIGKCLYLDSDLICLKDVEELWNFDITNYFAGVVKDVASNHFNKKIGFPLEYNYFNAGVLLLNLENIRKIDFIDECMKFYESKKDRIIAQDQDILNGVFYDKCLYLPMIWNLCTPVYQHVTYAYENLSLYQQLQIIKSPGIVHFTGIYKPWETFVMHPFKEKYWKYLALTSFKYSYFAHLFIKLFSYIFRFEYYENGKKSKILSIYVLGLFSFKQLINKTKNYKKITILNTVKYLRLKNKYRKRKFVYLFNRKIYFN